MKYKQPDNSLKYVDSSNKPCLGLLLFIISIFSSFNLLAQVDELSVSLNREQPRPLRWGNIEDGYQWLGGEKPYKNGSRYKIRLKEDNSTILRLPAAAHIKLVNLRQYESSSHSERPNLETCHQDTSHRADDKLNIVDSKYQFSLMEVNNLIRIEQSSDGYLFLEKQWLSGVQSNTWLAAIQEFEASAIRLSLIKQPSSKTNNASKRCVEFEIYYSQYTAPLKLSRYSEEVVFDGIHSDIEVRPSDGAQRFNVINGNDQNIIEITGPVDLEIQVRKKIMDHVPISGDIDIELTLDANETKKIIMEYFPEIKQSVQIDGQLGFTSRLSKAYYSVPAGKHQLLLKSNSDIYLRLLKQGNNDYSLFGLNQPEWIGIYNEDNKNNKNNKKKQRENGELSEHEWRQLSKQQYQDNGSDFAARYQSIQTLARDNAIYNSGLAALGLLTQELNQSLDRPFLAHLIKRNEKAHGSFKTLHPSHNGKSVSHKLERFMGRQLGEKNSEDIFKYQADYLYNTNLRLKAEYLQNIPRASFFSMKESLSHTFILPKRNNTTQIRIIIPHQLNSDSTLKVTLDNGLEYFIRTSKLPINEKYYATDLARQIIQSQCCVTALNREDNSPIIEVGKILIPIESNVRSFKLSSNSNQLDWAAVQVYTANSHNVSEEAYINLVQSKNASYTDFRQLVRAQVELMLGKEVKSNVSSIGTDSSIDTDIKTKANSAGINSQLDNQWLPLARHFASIHKAFSAGLDIENMLPKSEVLLSKKQYKNLQLQAMKFEKLQQWVLATEIWSEIARNTKGEQQIKAIFKLENALTEQGSYRMADKLLRGLSLQNFSRPASILAFDILYARYISTEQFDKAHNLLISSFISTERIELLQKVIQSLVARGQWKDALQLAHLTAVHHWPYESVLLAASKSNWWLTFKLALPNLPESEQRLWLGHANYIQGDFSQARNDYKQSLYFGQSQVHSEAQIEKPTNDGKARNEERDRVAMEWLAFTDNSLSLIQQFTNDNNDIHRNSNVMRNWLKLSSQNPSPKVWHRAPNIIRKHGGGIKVFNQERLLSFDGFVSAQHSPVELEIIGPAKIRLSVRPVLSEKEAFKDNMIVPQSSFYRVVSETNSDTFSIVDSLASTNLTIENSDEFIGSASTNEFELGNGIHHIKVISDRKIAVFPEELKSSISPLGLFDFDRTKIATLLSQSNSERTKAEKINIRSVANLESKLYQQLVDYLSILIDNSGQKNITNKSHLLPSQILALAKNSVTNYSQKYDLSERILKVMNKISQNASWRPVRNIIQSAGIRQLEEKQWQVETPSWRSYISLFDTRLEEKRILTPGKPITLNLFNPHQTQLNLQLESLSPWFLSKPAVTFSYRINNGKLKTLSISSLKNVSLTLPAGNQSISFEMSRTEYDQFLSLKINEKDGRSIDSSARKSYHISTKDEPFEAIIDGPSWIRIDRLTGSHTSSQYRFVDKKQFKLRVLPKKNQSEVLLRIFEWHIGSQSESDSGLLPRKKIVDIAKRVEMEKSERLAVDRILLESIENEKVRLRMLEELKIAKPNQKNQDINQRQIKLLTDSHFDSKSFLKNNWQDGTISYHTNFTTRQSVEDEATSEIDEFIELGANYRYFHDFDDVWYKYGGGLRLRGDNDSSLALNGSVIGRFNWAPINWKLSTNLYLQELDESTAIGSKLDFTISQRRPLGIVSAHQPKLNFFTRAHKLDFKETEFVDSDIYTDYKANHLYGIKISDRFSYKPYVDSEYYLSGSVLSNEDILEPDQWAANIGLRQLMGHFLLNLQLNSTHFLEDKNRLLKSVQTKLKLKVGWELWQNNQNRFEASLDYQHNFEQDENNLKLQFVYHLSSERGYRDFSPEEIGFRDLRTSMQPLNNNHGSQYYD